MWYLSEKDSGKIQMKETNFSTETYFLEPMHSLFFIVCNFYKLCWRHCVYSVFGCSNYYNTQEETGWIPFVLSCTSFLSCCHLCLNIQGNSIRASVFLTLTTVVFLENHCVPPYPCALDCTPCWQLGFHLSGDAASHFLGLLFMFSGSGRGWNGFYLECGSAGLGRETSAET